MLVDIHDLPNKTEEDKSALMDYWFRGVVAVDPETGAELLKSRASRRTGKPRTYGVWAWNGTTYIHYFYNYATKQREPSISKPKDQVFGLTAFSDTQAIEKSNKRLDKAMKKFMAEEYKECTREQGKDF